jgi:beta-xylosidase
MDLSEQPCNKSDNFDKVVASCQQVVPNQLTTCAKQCEYILLADMLQDERFLRVQVNSAWSIERLHSFPRDQLSKSHGGHVGVTDKRV